MVEHGSQVDSAPLGTEASAGSWLREVWRRKLVVAAVLVVTVAAAVLASSLTTPTYTATAAAKVSSGSISDGPQSSATVGTLLATQVEVLESTQLSNEVAEQLDPTVTIYDVRVEGVPESQVATVTVEASTAKGAADAANAYVLTYQERRNQGVIQEATSRADALQRQVEQFAAQLETLQAQVDEEVRRVNLEQARITVARDNAARAGVALGPEDVVLPNTSTLSALQARYSDLAGQLSTLRGQELEYRLAAEAGNGGVAIVSVATPPTGSSAPGLPRTIALGVLLGLALGIGLALLMGLADRRLHDVAAVRRSVRSVPVLAVAGRTHGHATPGARVEGVLVPSAGSPVVDAYAEVSLVLAAQWAEPMRVVLVAGATSAEGSTGAAGALAVALAQSGKDVLLVPEQGGTATGKWSGLHESTGEGVTSSSALVNVHISAAGSLQVLPRGIAPSVAELRWLLDAATDADAASSGPDVVVVEGAPLLEGSRSLSTAAQVDAVVVPVLLGASHSPDVVEACDKVAAVGGRVVGTVVHTQPVHPVDADQPAAAAGRRQVERGGSPDALRSSASSSSS